MRDDYIETFSDLSEYITGNRGATIGAVERKLNDCQFHRVKLAYRPLGECRGLIITIPCDWLEPDEYPRTEFGLPVSEYRFEKNLKQLYEEADELFDMQYGG